MLKRLKRYHPPYQLKMPDLYVVETLLVTAYPMILTDELQLKVVDNDNEYVVGWLFVLVCYC